jgi:hypothetical protein
MRIEKPFCLFNSRLMSMNQNETPVC